MPYITALVASIDARLDELAHDISALQDARAALATHTLASTPASSTDNGSTTRPRRSTRQAKRSAPTSVRQSLIDPTAMDPLPPDGSKSAASEPSRRVSRKATSGRPSVALQTLSAERLDLLLAGATSGVSARAIAEQTGVGHRRVLTQLRSLEASGKIRRTGSRRSTLWLPITDEERIAQRVAELEHQLAARRHDRSQRRARARAS